MSKNGTRKVFGCRISLRIKYSMKLLSSLFLVIFFLYLRFPWSLFQLSSLQLMFNAQVSRQLKTPCLFTSLLYLALISIQCLVLNLSSLCCVSYLLLLYFYISVLSLKDLPLGHAVICLWYWTTKPSQSDALVHTIDVNCICSLCCQIFWDVHIGDICGWIWY